MRKKIMGVLTSLLLVTTMLFSCITVSAVDAMQFNTTPTVGQSLTAIYTEAESVGFYGWYTAPESSITFTNGVPTSYVWVDIQSIAQYGATISVPSGLAGRYIFCNACRSSDYSTIQTSVIAKIEDAFVDPLMSFNPNPPQAGVSNTALFTATESGFFLWYVVPAERVVFTDGVATALDWGTDYLAQYNLPQYGQSAILPADSVGKYLYSKCCRTTDYSTIQESHIVQIVEAPYVDPDPLMKYNPTVPQAGQSVTAKYTGTEVPSYFGWYIFPADKIIFENDIPVGTSVPVADWVPYNIPQYYGTMTLPADCNGKYLTSLAARADYSTIQWGHYALIGDYPVNFGTYTVSEDRVLSGLIPGTTVQQFLGAITKTATTDLVFTGADNNVKGLFAKLGTGTTVNVNVSGGTTIATKTVLIYGDSDGDGDTDVADLGYMKLHLLKSSVMTGVFEKSSDITKDGKTTISDLLMMKQAVIGMTTITQ